MKNMGSVDIHKVPYSNSDSYELDYGAIKRHLKMLVSFLKPEETTEGLFNILFILFWIMIVLQLFRLSVQILIITT